MKTGKRLVYGLVIGLSLFVCLTSALADPYAILHNFGATGDGFQPYYGAPALSGSTLYGMTQGATLPNGDLVSGALYKINTDGSGYQILHTFKNLPPDGDGTSPRGSLTLSGSTLYGCCPYGGQPYIQVGGAVFKINTDGGGYQVLYSFGPGDVQCHPYGAPVISGSKLYGMTSSIDSGHFGEIFVMNTGGPNTPGVLHEFAGKPDDGAFPYGSLTLVGSTLYGMTSTGGRNGIDGGGSGYGVIFKVDTDGNNYQVLHHFEGFPNDGNNPTGSLTLVDNRLYGMTASGGSANGPGVIFSIGLNGNDYRVLLDLSTIGGIGGPLGSLTLAGSKLYGMTSGGGPGGASGVIFQINLDGTGFQILHGFMSSEGDGGLPMGDLTFSNSTLYGWTYAGGTNGAGVFFSYQPPVVPPTIAVDATSFTNSCLQGKNAPAQGFQIWNSGEQTLDYTITTDVAWLNINPNSGSSTGEPQSTTVNYLASSLKPGRYQGNITITAPGATNSPLVIPVSLKVVYHNLTWWPLLID
jgi:uncharacterized repeat protein (TIGR03803 family)